MAYGAELSKHGDQGVQVGRRSGRGSGRVGDRTSVLLFAHPGGRGRRPADRDRRSWRGRFRCCRRSRRASSGPRAGPASCAAATLPQVVTLADLPVGEPKSQGSAANSPRRQNSEYQPWRGCQSDRASVSGLAIGSWFRAGPARVAERALARSPRSPSAARSSRASGPGVTGRRARRSDRRSRSWSRPGGSSGRHR